MYTGSILPKYRGASPIQQAVLNGDSKTGITTMYMEEKMDTGNIIEQEEMAIERIDTSKTMFEKLAILGAKTLVSTSRKIEENNGNIVSIKQNDDDATYTSMITKDMAIIDFNKNFEEIYNKIRGLNDFLVARIIINNKIYKIWKAEDKIYTLDEIKQNYNNFETIKREDSLGNKLEIIIIKERKDKKLLFKCNDRIY
jgi:methionyl-tRNA formyltransferase